MLLYLRYDTPTRPRTSSYSSRSSAAASQCNTNAVPSPGTPGTPRGSSSRSRLSRFPEYYDQTGVEYTERHFRSYDEYSQGSAASHEDFYDHEHIYNHDSPTHLDALETRALVSFLFSYSSSVLYERLITWQKGCIPSNKCG